MEITSKSSSPNKKQSFFSPAFEVALFDFSFGEFI
jgi:hypothetical protein